MKLLRTLASVGVAVILASALGGCVVVPVPFGYGGGGYYHHDHR